MRGLGRIFDIGTAWAPVDLNTADGATGKRISMARGTACTFLATCGVAAGGTDDIVFTVSQHTAYTGGTTSNLASATIAGSTGITSCFIKSETTLDNDEAWVEQTQAEGATVTLAGATYAAVQKIVAFTVNSPNLGAGYTHISVSVAVASLGNAELAAGLYIVHDLKWPRTPQNLANLLNPGAANV